jgi:hypothetical protein
LPDAVTWTRFAIALCVFNFCFMVLSFFGAFSLFQVVPFPSLSIGGRGASFLDALHGTETGAAEFFLWTRLHNLPACV